MKEYHKWAFKKNEPNVFFRVHLLGSNGIIEYYLPEDEVRHSAWLDEIVFIDEKDVPLKRNKNMMTCIRSWDINRKLQR